MPLGRRMAPRPERLVIPDQAWLTQYGKRWSPEVSDFRCRPRTGLETDISVLTGLLAPEEATKLVTGRSATRSDALRFARAGELKAAEFFVASTPTKRIPNHASVTVPAGTYHGATTRFSRLNFAGRRWTAMPWKGDHPARGALAMFGLSAVKDRVVLDYWNGAPAQVLVENSAGTMWFAWNIDRAPQEGQLWVYDHVVQSEADMLIDSPPSDLESWLLGEKCGERFFIGASWAGELYLVLETTVEKPAPGSTFVGVITSLLALALRQATAEATDSDQRAKLAAGRDALHLASA